MQSFSLTDARAQLPQLLDRVAAGESFTITRHGTAVAVLTGKDEWMTTKTHDVVIKARALAAEREAMRGQPLGEPVDFDADSRVAELYRDREADDARDPRGPL
jgi:prevent-host-death family protein